MKMRLKKKLFISLSFLTFISIQTMKAQFVVSAPVMETAMFQELANTLQMISGIQQQINQGREIIRQGKEVAKTIEVVSAAIKQIELTKDIVRTQQSINKLVNEDYKKIRESGYFDVDEMAEIALSFRGLVQSIQVNVQLIDGLLKSGQFKIDDEGRITQLQQAKERLQEIYAESVSYRVKKNKLISKRAIIQTFSSKP